MKVAEELELTSAEGSEEMKGASNKGAAEKKGVAEGQEIEELIETARVALVREAAGAVGRNSSPVRT